MQRRDAIKRISLLMGGTLSAPTLAGLLGGCQPSGEEGYALQALTPEQNELVATLAEAIIPETDTPGARAAGVHEFIDTMLAEWYPDEDRQRFLDGLAEVEARAQEQFGSGFVDADPEQQTELMTQLDREAYPVQPAAEEDPEGDVEGAVQSGTDAVEREREAEVIEDTVENRSPFFRTLKELTVSGYYTSEIGATQELHVNPMGTYRGDVPYAEIGKAWA